MAQDVVEIMKASMFDLCSDEFVPVEVDECSKSHGSKNANSFMKVLNRNARDRQTNVFTTSEMLSIAKSAGVNTSDFDLFLDRLNQQNLILYKGGNRYQLMK